MNTNLKRGLILFLMVGLVLGMFALNTNVAQAAKPTPKPQETETQTPKGNNGSSQNPQQTGCNSNNPKNCPTPAPKNLPLNPICGQGKHTGNPHCQPAPSNTPEPKPSSTVTATATATQTSTVPTVTNTVTSTPVPGNSTQNNATTATAACGTCCCTITKVDLQDMAGFEYAHQYTLTVDGQTWKAELFNGTAKDNNLSVSASSFCQPIVVEPVLNSTITLEVWSPIGVVFVTEVSVQ